MKLRLSLLCGFLLLGACATSPEVKYAVEAEKVTAQALEPVMLESADLENDLATKFKKQLPAAKADELIQVIQTEIANTKRFTKVLLNSSEGDTYIVQPRIDRLDGSLRDIPTDPTRKRFAVKSKVSLNVYLADQRGHKELVKSFYDERSLDERISSKSKLTDEMKQEYFERAVKISFKAAADQLGNGFNPSYEMGTISRLSGRTAHVQINTSRLKKMPKKQQAVEVIDDDNKVLATLAELTVDDGSLSGKIFERSGASIKEGSRVRARVNALTE